MSIKEGDFEAFEQELLQLLRKYNLSLGLTGYWDSTLGVFEYDEEDGYFMCGLENKVSNH